MDRLEWLEQKRKIETLQGILFAALLAIFSVGYLVHQDNSKKNKEITELRNSLQASHENYRELQSDYTELKYNQSDN